MSNERPTGITVIGWIWIILGAVVLFGSLIDILLFGFIPATSGNYSFSSSGYGSDPQTMYNLFQAVFIFFRHWWIFLTLQLVVGGLSLIGGIAFLGLKEWGRILLEILSWFYLIYNIAAGALWVYMTSYLRNIMTGNMQGTGMASDLTWVLTVFGLSILLAFCVGIVLMIRYLRSRKVYNAISNLPTAEESITT